MRRIQDKLRYIEHLLDVFDDAKRDGMCLFFLAINPSDEYDITTFYDSTLATERVKLGYDLWTIDIHEHLDDVAEEIASQYYFIR